MPTSTTSSSVTMAQLTVTGTTTLTGAVTTTGGTTGDNTGRNTGPLTLNALTYTASTTLNRSYGLHILDGSSSSLTVTIAAPTVGDIHTFFCTDATSSAQLQLTAGTFDGSNNTAHFAAASAGCTLVGVTATRYIILSSVGTLTFD